MDTLLSGRRAAGLISSLVWIIHTTVTWYWKVRPQRWRAACVDWKQTGGECWLEVVMWALASRWPWGSYIQTCWWQNKLQKVGLERTHNNSAWPVFAPVHSSWPCLITATTFQFIPSRAKDGNEFLSDSRTSGPPFFYTITSSHRPSVYFHFGDWTQFKCSQTLHQTSLCSFRHWPTFSQSGACKWSSHTLNGRDYATNSRKALWFWCFTPEKYSLQRWASLEAIAAPITASPYFGNIAKEVRGENYPGKR